MIEIQMYENGFIVQGHAGYAESGKDIVCAAISALSQTCRMSIDELTDDTSICVEDSGFMSLKCNCPTTEKTKLLLKAFETGVSAISESYEKFVRIVRIRCVNL